MINYVIREEEIEKPLTITCDVCGRSWDWNSLESQEFISIRQEGGFTSIFGDGIVISLDICQHCLKDKLGEFIW